MILKLFRKEETHQLFHCTQGDAFTPHAQQFRRLHGNVASTGNMRKRNNSPVLHPDSLKTTNRLTGINHKCQFTMFKCEWFRRLLAPIAKQFMPQFPEKSQSQPCLFRINSNRVGIRRINQTTTSPQNNVHPQIIRSIPRKNSGTRIMSTQNPDTS